MNKQGAYDHWGRGRFVAAALVLVLVAAVGACSSARVKQFQDFSTAGQAYTKAMVKLLEETKVFVVDADSERLLMNRTSDPGKRKKMLADRDHATALLVAALDQIQSQTVLLGLYFKGLADLAESEAPSRVAEELQGTIKSLGEMQKGVAEAKLNGKPIAAYVAEPIKLVLTQFQVAALEKEMRKNGGVIAELLDLQVKAAKAVEELLARESRINRAAQNSRYKRSFTKSQDLGDEWIRLRRQLLLPGGLTAGKQVCEAAVKLRKSYVELAAGRFSQYQFNDLMDGIGGLADLAEKMKGEDEDGN